MFAKRDKQREQHMLKIEAEQHRREQKNALATKNDQLALFVKKAPKWFG